jgi:hypothetical protein
VLDDGPRQANRRVAEASRAATVPYIVSWSAERLPQQPVVVPRGGYGIGYLDETPDDRDRRGVLWQRTALAQGNGRPEFGRIHALRQRRAMRKLLCQVCGAPADRNEHGVLWLLNEPPAGSPEAEEQSAEGNPPVCLRCAYMAVRMCPHLRNGYVAVRVKAPRIAGVFGALYRPGGLLPKAVDAITVRYDDPRIRWMVAGQLMMTLHGCTVVDLDAELATTATAR